MPEGALRRFAFRSWVSTAPLGAALVCAGLALGACGDKEEVKPDLAPKLGVLELAASHRTDDPEPSGAARIEITPSELLLDGEQVLPLENGKLPAAEKSGYDLPKLKAKLSGKKALAMGVYASVPDATLARVIWTGIQQGANEFSFRVRKPNSTNKTGWLTLRNIRFIEKPDDSKFEESQLLPWDSFAKGWDESLDACQGTTKGDCGYKPLAKAQGGKLDFMLRVRGTGYALRFRQAGAPPAPAVDAGVAPAPDKTASAKKAKPKKKKRAELMDGIKAAPEAPEEAPPEPSTEHVFTLRTEVATADPSPISGITKPVCGSIACPVVLDAEGISMSSQVLAILGAAFPDGTPAPIVAWVLPPKD
ncbi:MAG: hypothetical protein RLZZ450_2048 [Pseudomonadota bacterium]